MRVHALPDARDSSWSNLHSLAYDLIVHVFASGVGEAILVHVESHNYQASCRSTDNLDCSSRTKD